MRGARILFCIVLLSSAAGAVPPAARSGACTPHGQASHAGLGFGEAELIDFGPASTINRFWVRVHEGFIRVWVADDFRLNVTITSVDGYPGHFHGTAFVPLSAMTVASTSGDLVTLEVPWTEDEEPQVVGDLYTVCTQLFTSIAVGPEPCQDFGPFF